MHDALARVVKPEQSDAVRLRIVGKAPDHRADGRVGDGGGAAARRHVMVGDREGEIGPRHLRAPRRHLGKGMVRAFMHEMPIDPQQARAILAREYLVRIPQFVEQGLRRRSGHPHRLPP